MPVNRRSLLTGLVSLIAAPAIVRAASLMPVRGIVMPVRVPALSMMSVSMMSGIGGFDDNYGFRLWVEWARNIVQLSDFEFCRGEQWPAA